MCGRFFGNIIIHNAESYFVIQSQYFLFNRSNLNITHFNRSILNIIWLYFESFDHLTLRIGKLGDLILTLPGLPNHQPGITYGKFI